MLFLDHIGSTLIEYQFVGCVSYRLNFCLIFWLGVNIMHFISGVSVFISFSTDVTLSSVSYFSVTIDSLYFKSSSPSPYLNKFAPSIQTGLFTHVLVDFALLQRSAGRSDPGVSRICKSIFEFSSVLSSYTL